MIKYVLSCEHEHVFESWFSSGASFDAQAKRGLLTCPACHSQRIAKAPMAPMVIGAKRAAPDDGKPLAVALLDERQQRLRDMARTFRREVEAGTVDVGHDFPRAARAIHDGDAPERPIRGQASLAEAKALIEEGVGVMPLPPFPDELN